jgi:peptide/nickel transport system substrate-binding protein
MKVKLFKISNVILLVAILMFSLFYALPVSAAASRIGNTITVHTCGTNTATTTKESSSVISFDTTSATTSVSTTVNGNWWDSLGTPQYGGSLNEKLALNITVWDPYMSTNGQAGYAPYLESMWINNYATDPSIWDFEIGWLPDQYAAGNLVNSYSMPNPYTVICNLRQNIYWQNLPPANGRQFTATDVVYHYDRLLGLGGGFTKDPYYVSVTGWNPLLSVVATDKFTVTFNWQQGAVGPTSILTTMEAAGADNSIEDPEAVQAYTTLSQPILTHWQNAIGTGPFMLTNFVDSSSATFVKNPNYWGQDLRWPQNQLPYLDNFNVLIITSTATAEAALRVGKIDSLSSVPTQDGLSIMQTNPTIIVKQKPQGTEYTLDPRNDVAPFNILNVRIAMQHAIDISTIASVYYLGYAIAWPASLTQNQMGIGGWGDPYSQWPSDVQAQYSYNPTLSKQMLAAAGFPNGFSTDLVLETDADQGLYQIVQSELAAVGVNLSITTMDTASWQAYVMTGHKEDALSARNQGTLGFNYDIFRQFLRFTPGYQSNYILVNDTVITQYNTNAITAQSVSSVKQLLHDENLYIAQQHLAISLAQPSVFNMVQPWVKGNMGVNPLGDAVTGAGFIIGAGFSDGVPLGVWIDRNLKYSEGFYDSPTVTDSAGASSITPVTATLNGSITSTGGDNPTVHIYWGTSDGNTTATNWANDINLGTLSDGNFSSNISGLTGSTRYYYRCYASNSAGNTWASVTTSFTTPIGVVVNAPAKVPANNYQFDVPINLSQVSNFYGAQFDVLYDSTVLQYVSTTWGQIGSTQISGNGTAQSAIITGGRRFVISLNNLSSGISGSGTMLTLRFQVIGSMGQSSSINLANGILSDFNAQSIPATWVNGSVQVAVIAGDANGDGTVNVLDLTKVSREILGLDSVTPGADANLDGNVNVLDMTKISRIILGLDAQ